MPNITVHHAPGRSYATTGSKWEPLVGKSRAVRVGLLIFVSGTVGANPDGSFAPGVGAQARRALEIIRGAIEALGGKLSDVVRTRWFLVDIADVPEAGGVHAEVLGDIRPACMMVQVARLVDGARVEIEAEAVVAHA